MSSYLENKDKGKLLETFEGLKSVKDKLNFWNKEFKISYAFFALVGDQFGDFQRPTSAIQTELFDFRIIPLQNEFKEYNILILQEYRNYVLSISSRRKSIWDLAELIEAFESRYKTAANKKPCINQAVVELDKLIKECEKIGNKQIGTAEEWFNSVFNSVYLNNEDYDLSRSFYDILVLVTIHNAQTFARYRKFLDDKLDSLSSKAITKATKQTEFSIRKQLQILHYFGVLELIEQHSNVKKADFLAPLLSKSSQNIRAEFSKTKGLTTSILNPERKEIKRELEHLFELFTEFGIKSASKKVKADIEKLS